MGTWSGNVVVPGGGGLGLEPAQAEGGKPEGEGGAGPQRPLPAAAPRPGLLFRSPFGRDPRSASDSGSRPPPPPCPGLEPPQTREARDGAGAAAASRPSFPHHPSPPRWTSGPWAPHRLSSGNLPRPARLPGLAPPTLRSPQASPRPDFRLPLDAPSQFPPSPPPPAWSGVGGRGGVRPAPSPPRPAPRDSPCMAGPGGGCGGGPGAMRGGHKGGRCACPHVIRKVLAKCGCCFARGGRGECEVARAQR